MDILFVLNDYAFFLTHRLPIARACRDRGWNVHIATPRKDEAAEQAAEEGFSWHSIAMDPSSQNPLKELQALWSLTQLYRELQPDLVHHVTVKPILYGSLAARITRVPAVVNALSGLGYFFINETLKDRLVRRAILSLMRVGFRHPNSRLILQNEDDREVVLGYDLLDNTDITMIRGSGVNTETFSYKPEDDSKVRVVLPGRMLWDKGVGEFVEAARKLKEEGINASFHLYGKPDEKNPRSISLEQLNRWDEEPAVCYEGYRKDMVSVLQKANIVCLPSYREGLPKALLEAASVGRPIITTDAPGCREVVEHGQNGYLVPVKDVNQMADKIRELVANPELRKRFGRKGRQKVIRNLSVDKVVRETLELYDSLMVRKQDEKLSQPAYADFG